MTRVSNKPGRAGNPVDDGAPVTRWEHLFADLAAQADELDRSERRAEVAERTRIEVAATRLRDRYASALDAQLRVTCLGGAVASGALRHVGAEWLLVAEVGARETLVPLQSIVTVTGLGHDVTVRHGRVAQRLGLTTALRAVSIDRSQVRISLTDGSEVVGTLDRVGADYLDVAVHAAGEARRRSAVVDRRVIATHALALVTRDNW